MKIACYLLPCHTASLRIGRVPDTPSGRPVALFIAGVATTLLDNCVRALPLTPLFDLIVCELPGHGRTFAVQNTNLDSFARHSQEVEDVSLTGFAREYAAVLDLYVPRQEPVCIIGESLGGLIGAEVARLRPDRVNRLILLDTPFRLTPPPLAALLAKFWARDRLPYHRRIYREIFGFDPKDGATGGIRAFHHLMEGVQAPSTVVAGWTDYVLDPPIEERPPSQLTDDDLGLLAVYPGVTVLPRVPNAGHCVLNDNPEACIAALTRHLGG